MPKPNSLNEALERAPKLSDESLANQLAQKGLRKLEIISNSAVKEFNSLSKSSKDDLGKIDVIEASEMSVSNDNAVIIIGSMVSSPTGLTELATVTQLLLQLSGASESKNARSAIQLLAWMKNGKDLFFEDKLNKFGSMANQFVPAIERALRTPANHWGEVIDKISSGGGMKYLAEVFAGTPAEVILEVVAKSLVNSLKLREEAQKIERSKEDVQRATLGLRRTVSTRTKAGREHLQKFQKAKDDYRNLQTQIDSLKSFDEEGAVISAEQMVQLDKLAKECEVAFVEFQKWTVLVQTNPAMIEEVRAGLSHGMHLTDSLALNQARLENLSIQFRQNALLRVFQLVIALSAISSFYCDRVLAENRKMQMLIVENCGKTLDLVARGRFEEAIGDSELSMALSPA